MPSPKPKPAQLKLIEGRGHGRDSGGRPVPETPAFARVPPRAPMWLPEEARAEWNRVVPELARLELLKPIDSASLTAYCLAWDRLMKATVQVEREGYVVKDDRVGRAQRHPAMVTIENASREIRAFAAEFGLTPSAESRLGRAKEGGDAASNPFAAPAASTG